MKEEPRRAASIAVGLVAGIHIATGNAYTILFWVVLAALTFVAMGLVITYQGK